MNCLLTIELLFNKTNIYVYTIVSQLFDLTEIIYEIIYQIFYNNITCIKKTN